MFENEPVAYVHTAVLRLGSGDVVLVGRCDVTGQDVSGIRVRSVTRSRPEAALVRQMIAEVRSRPGQTVVLGLRDPWIAKTHLQLDRRFRAPLLYGRVLELHEVARLQEVTLVGGLPVPRRLRDAIGRARDRLICRDAVERAGLSPPSGPQTPA